MTSGTQNELMSLLRDELPAEEARELRARIRHEPELAADFRRLEQAWNGLELPPPSPLPAGFTGRVMARVRDEKAARSLSWSSAPNWVRATAAASLVAGALLGVGVGVSWPAADTSPTAEGAIAGLKVSSGEELSLAAGYWNLIVDSTTGGEPEGRP
jgi:anti-sigma factor RsiW